MTETVARPLGAEVVATTSVNEEPGRTEEPGRNEEPGRSGNRLRRVLVVGDAVALIVAGLVALFLTGVATGARLEGLPVAAAAIVPGILALHVQHLYRGRVAASRSVELVGLMRTSLVVAVAGFLAARTHGNRASLSFAIVIGVLAFLALFAFRSQYRSWLSRARRRGLYVRRVVLIGDNSEGRELATLVNDHSELGIEIVGVVGVQGRARPRWVQVPYLEDRTRVFEFLDSMRANGVIVAATALPADDASPLVRDLHDHNIHVHYSLGLRGISIDRVRPLPFAHEPLFYVEQVTLSPFQHRIKRAIDIIGSFTALVLASPLLLIAALAIKLDDHGPIFFRQIRIGLHGEEFEILKLRSMTQSATVPHPSTGLQNERTDGPLFKLVSDPRRTKVGRILERTSIDELPQLINVLRGDMSLVGPRPALPEEVAVFDAELRQRHNVRPGITGLWQVEARDNPSFRAYRRLDLFYIENWSVGLDAAILLQTVEAVVARVCSVRKSNEASAGSQPNLTAVEAPQPVASST